MNIKCKEFFNLIFYIVHTHVKIKQKKLIRTIEWFKFSLKYFGMKSKVRGTFLNKIIVNKSIKKKH